MCKEYKEGLGQMKTTRNSAIIIVIGVAVALAFTSGCSTPAHRIDPEGPNTITTVSNLDIQDAKDAATDLAQSLLEAEVLGQDGKPSTIAIDQYVNTTDQDIDKDEVLKRLRLALNKAGVARVMTSINSEGEIGGESAIASKAAHEELKRQKIEAFLNDTKAPGSIRPDYALSFKIMEKEAWVGNIKQVVFTFQMTLTDVKSGTAVWEEQKQIAKQGSTASLIK